MEGGGDFWQASHYSHQNSLTKIKMNGNINEGLGNKQGMNKSSEHYKIYIAPLLDTLDSADLGVWVGPVNVSVSGVADDVYLMSDIRQNFNLCLILLNTMERCTGLSMEPPRPK